MISNLNKGWKIMVKPIVFDLTEDVVKNYHLVNRKDLHDVKDTDTLRKCIDELNLRVKHATKHYKGRYDEPHKNWMRTLAKPLKVSQKIGLSLDALVAISTDTSKPRYNHRK